MYTWISLNETAVRTYNYSLLAGLYDLSLCEQYWIQHQNIVTSIKTFRDCLLFDKIQINTSIVWSQSKLERGINTVIKTSHQDDKMDERGFKTGVNLVLTIPVEGILKAPSLSFWLLYNNPKIVKWRNNSHVTFVSVLPSGIYNYSLITHTDILIIIRAIAKTCNLCGLNYKSYNLSGLW